MDWQQRLQDWVDERHYTLPSLNVGATNTIEVVETASKGQGKVVFFSSNQLLKINEGNKNHLVFLKERKDTDGVFLEFIGNKLEAIHFVELKKTITTFSWTDVKSQTRSALKHTLGFLGVLGLEIPTRLVCHACFQNDDMAKELAANPVLMKALVGGKATSKALQLEKEWKSSKVQISSAFPSFELSKHPLLSLSPNSIPSAEVTL